jgi:hypothetical protein
VTALAAAPRRSGARAAGRGGFDQRRFDEALLSHGTSATKPVRALVLGR